MAFVKLALLGYMVVFLVITEQYRLLVSCQESPPPPVDGPRATIDVPAAATAVTASSVCGGAGASNQTDGEGQSSGESFFLPGTPSISRQCSDVEGETNPHGAQNVFQPGANPNQFWRSRTGDENVSLTFQFGQTFSIVYISFLLHTPLPPVMRIMGHRGNESSRLLGYAVPRKEDCQAISQLSLLPPGGRCVHVIVDADKPYPIVVEISVVRDTVAESSYSYGFLEFRAVDALQVEFVGVGLNQSEFRFMAVSDFRIRGRCLCSGHAEECQLTRLTRQPAVFPLPEFYSCQPCLHDTTGSQCQRCRQGFTAQTFSSRDECIPTLLAASANITIFGNVGESELLIPQKQTPLILSLTWFRDAQPVLFNRRIVRRFDGLHIGNAMLNDSGVYVAEVRNNNGMVEQVFFDVCILPRGFTQPFTSFPPRNFVTVLPGGVATLQCDIISLPATTVNWITRQQAAGSSNSTITIATTEQPADTTGLLLYRSALTVTGVVKADVGDYRCVATYRPPQCPRQMLEDVAISAIVLCQPEAVDMSTVGFVGQPVEVSVDTRRCTFLPNTSFVWVIDGVDIAANDSRVSAIGSANVTLTLTDLVQGRHNVLFVFRSGNDTVETPITLIILGPPVLEAISPQNITVTQGGGRVTISYRFLGSSPLEFIEQSAGQWTFNGINISRRDSRFSLTLTSLTVIQPSIFLAGVYRLVVTNPAGSDSLTFRLTVFVTPVIRQLTATPLPTYPSNEATFAGNVTCIVEGFPLPLVTMRGGRSQLFQLGSNPGGFFYRREEQQLESLLYRVTAHVAQSAVMVSGSNGYLCMAGDVSQRISFLPVVIGQVTGIVDSLIIPGRRTVDVAFLWQPAISNVNVRDIVHNFCYRNLDQPTLAMTTSTNTPTDNPEVPDAQTITASQMPITVRDGEPDNEETVSSMSPSNRDATTANEEPTASGERDRSKRHDADTGVTDIPHPDEMTTQAQHLIFQTIEGIGGGDEASGGEPTDPPVTTKEEISFNTRDNARPDGPGGPFGWTCTALLTRPVLTINGVDHTFDALLTNLPVSTRYAIVVQVATTDGIHNGEFTNESIFRTPDGVPFAPGNLTALNVTHEFVTLEWTAPSVFVGIITRYTVSVVTTPPSRTGNAVLNVSANGRDPFTPIRTNFTNLPPYRLIAFTVVAHTAAGPGDSATVTVANRLPYAPEGLVASAISETFAILRWRAPSLYVGDIIRYVVTLSGSFTMRIEQFSRDVRPTTQNLTEIISLNFTGLQPDRPATFRVTSFTAYGPGGYSEIVLRTLAPLEIPSASPTVSAPDYEQMIPVASRRFSSTELTWIVPAFSDPGSRIEFYQILLVRRSPSLAAPGSPALRFPPGSPQIVEHGIVNNASTRQFLAYVAGEVSPQDFAGGVAYFTAGGGNTVMSGFLSGVAYNNGPLLPETVYDAFPRAFFRRTSAGKRRRRRQTLSMAEDFDVVTGTYLFTQSTAAVITMAPFVSGGGSSIVGPIVGGVCAALALMLLLALFLLLKFSERGRRTATKYRVSVRLRSDSKQPNPMGQGHFKSVISNPAATLEESTEMSTVTTKDPLQRLESDAERLKRFSTKEFQDEYLNRVPIEVQDFPKYVERQKRNGNFRFDREYEIVKERSADLDASYAKNPRLKTKNRYANVSAATHSRVVLPAVGDEEFSDYINANYIDGYDCKREYIASQGPMKATNADFWRMIWYNDVVTVVMLTKLEEKGTIKCYQYWPPVGCEQYGEITVTLTDTMERSDFVVRTFKIAKVDNKTGEAIGDERLVTQFHFVSWPDYGVPLVATPLLHFLERVRAHQPRQENPVPLLMHCSAGIGRTGTLIGLDSLLQEAKVTNALDPYAFVLKMRECRSGMVQTGGQYVFLHDALLDALHFGRTAIGPHQVQGTLGQRLQQDASPSGVSNEWDLLETSLPHKLSSKQASCVANAGKNRSEFLPYDFNRVRLKTVPGVEGSDYINASYIDGWSKKGQFIAAESPMKKTQSAFWSMIWREQIAVVMALEVGEKPEAYEKGIYWPTDSDKFLKVDDLTIILLDSQQVTLTESSLPVFKLLVRRDESDKELYLSIYHLSAFLLSDSNSTLPRPVDMLMILSAMETTHAESASLGATLIHCRDGSSKCGTLLTLVVSLARLRDAQTVDVLQTVRGMRAQRQGCVPSEASYRYIYECLLEGLSVE